MIDGVTFGLILLWFATVAIVIMLWPDRKRPRHRGRFRYAIGLPILKEKGGDSVLELSCTNEQKVPITVNPVTATGNPVALDGPVSVSVQSGAGAVEMIDDRSFCVVSGDQPGDTVFLVSGDADLGEGIETISDLITLHVEGAKAQSLGLVAGEAVPK